MNPSHSQETQDMMEQALASGDTRLLHALENSSFASLDALLEQFKPHASGDFSQQRRDVVEVGDPNDSSARSALYQHDLEL